MQQASEDRLERDDGTLLACPLQWSAMNAHITRTVLAFAAASLAATLLPLLDGGGGVPLIGVADRGASVVVYVAFLVLFGIYLFPRFVARAADSSRVIWCVLAAAMLVFAAIPLVFTAYISGVSVRGLGVLAAIVAATWGLGLLLARLAGPRVGAVLTAGLGTAFFAALPGAIVYLDSVSRPLAPIWTDLSPAHWIHAVARDRVTPPIWPFALAAVVPWLLATVPLRRGVRTAASVACVCAALSLLAATPVARVAPTVSAPATQGGEGVAVRALLPDAVRLGARTPLAIRIAPRDGAPSDLVELAIQGDWRRGRADGVERRYSFVVSQRDPQLTVRWSDGVERRMPLAAVDPVPGALRVIGTLGVAEEVSASWGTSVRAVRLDALADPLAGDLEGIDAFVVSGDWRTRTPAPLARAVERRTRLGTPRFEIGQATGDRLAASGLVRSVPAAALGAALAGVSIRPPAAIDRGLVEVFAPPGWQELDLSALLLFAIAYHVVFLLVFLVPLRLDGGKALGVYLSSVSFVVLVVAGVAWNVLDRIFLAETQVYSHQVGIAIADDGQPGRYASHRFLCFASMSGETRDLRFAASEDLLAIRAAAGARGPVLERADGGITAHGVPLDRYRSRLVLREDRTGTLPFRFVSDGEALRLEIEPLAEGDPLGTARVTALFSVEGGQWARAWRREGERFVPTTLGADGAAVPREAELFYRRLAGRFLRPPRGRYLLALLEGLPRPDDTDSYFWVRDLGTWLVLPMPEGR